MRMATDGDADLSELLGQLLQPAPTPPTQLAPFTGSFQCSTLNEPGSRTCIDHYQPPTNPVPDITHQYCNGSNAIRSSHSCFVEG